MHLSDESALSYQSDCRSQYQRGARRPIFPFCPCPNHIRR
jgi:hypothetical protein